MIMQGYGHRRRNRSASVPILRARHSLRTDHRQQALLLRSNTAPEKWARRTPHARRFKRRPRHQMADGPSSSVGLFTFVEAKGSTAYPWTNSIRRTLWVCASHKKLEKCRGKNPKPS